MALFSKMYENVIYFFADGLCKFISYWRKDYQLRLGERQGYVLFWPKTGNKRYWLHGASLGEMRQVLYLETMIRTMDPNAEFVITCVTPSGSALCTKGSSSYHCYMPYSTSSSVSRFIDHVRPDKLFIIETELWPGLIRTVSRHKIPIHLVNGRLGAGSCRLHAVLRYIRAVIPSITSIASQSVDDAQSFLDLGGQHVSMLGNLKWALASYVAQPLPYMIERWSLMAASVQIGEKEALTQVWKHFQYQNNPIQMVIAPRRLETLSSWLTGWGESVRVVLESQWKGEDFDILLIDSFGRLDLYYPVANVVFVGGSWVSHGGQNVLEPAGFGKCITMGPSDYNFSQVVKMLSSAGGMKSFSEIDAWIAFLDACRKDISLASDMGHRAKVYVDQVQKITQEDYSTWLRQILAS